MLKLNEMQCKDIAAIIRARVDTFMCPNLKDALCRLQTCLLQNIARIKLNEYIYLCIEKHNIHILWNDMGYRIQHDYPNLIENTNKEILGYLKPTQLNTLPIANGFAMGTISYIAARTLFSGAGIHYSRI